jgi:hypothetical protein
VSAWRRCNIRHFTRSYDTIGTFNSWNSKTSLKFGNGGSQKQIAGNYATVGGVIDCPDMSVNTSEARPRDRTLISLTSISHVARFGCGDMVLSMIDRPTARDKQYLKTLPRLRCAQPSAIHLVLASLSKSENRHVLPCSILTAKLDISQVSCEEPDDPVAAINVIGQGVVLRRFHARSHAATPLQPCDIGRMPTGSSTTGIVPRCTVPSLGVLRFLIATVGRRNKQGRGDILRQPCIRSLARVVDFWK